MTDLLQVEAAAGLAVYGARTVPGAEDARGQLVAPGVVNTMPEPTIHAFADHGEVRPDAVTGAYDDAQRALDQLAEVGVDYDDVVDTLEREGVEKFSASWQELLDGISKSLDAAKAGASQPTRAAGEVTS